MEQKTIQAYLEIADYLVRKDETLMAIDVLKSVPGLYRDKPVQEIEELKNLIGSKIFTASDYVNNKEDDVKPNFDNGKMVLNLARGIVLHDLVTKYNTDGVIPHIVDFGPGDFTIPLGLNALGKKFTYSPIGLRDESTYEAKKLLEHVWCTRDVPDRPILFVAYEVIEHLHHIEEIRNTYDRIKGNKAHVLLSTPTYTYGDGNPTWKERGCPHLRTYTPQEFINVAMKMFPLHNWKYFANEVMVLHGLKEGST